MDDLLRDIITESAEGLAQLDRDIVALEKEPENPELINRIFRGIHTIKGNCGFFDLDRLQAVAHATESVLFLVREREIEATPVVIDEVLAGVDAIKDILDALDATGREPPGDDAGVIAVLVARGEGKSPPASTRREFGPARGPDAAATAVPASTDSLDTRPLEPPLMGEARRPVAEATLRVNVLLLDRLMNLVSELVLARNQLTQLATAAGGSPFGAPVQHLDRVTTDLQDAVMRTRMQPMGGAWGKLPRVVRDLAAASGKQIELEMHGAETELDRQVLQAIQDPLTHMVRNAVDHGLEPAEVRRASGKPAVGTIRLSARHEGGHVVLEVTDDGAGIDIERVRQKAVERGLAGRDALAAMPDAQVLRFIFEAGFSTATRVTRVSGRGVGMDVVRSNVERIGGTVHVVSRAGQGTTVRIQVPLTLAIASALVVTTGDQLLAIPQVSVVELVRVTELQRHRVEVMDGSRFYRLRGSLLPLIELSTVLRLGRRREEGDMTIIVCQVGEARYGVIVDEVVDTREIVVKPVGRLTRHLVYTGCTILGDGRVIMILDPAGIARTARGQLDHDRAARRAAFMEKASAGRA